MKTNSIKIIILFFIAGVSFLAFTLFVDRSSDLALSQNNTSLLAAADQGYVPITPGFQETLADVDSGDGLSGILNLIFVWGIRLAIALAIVFVVFGAVQYMTTDAIYDKKEGKQRIQAAIGGLILALVSWLILYTINPDILKGGFLNKLDKLEPSEQEGGVNVEAVGGTNNEAGTGDTGPTETGDTGPTETDPNSPNE